MAVSCGASATPQWRIFVSLGVEESMGVTEHVSNKCSRDRYRRSSIVRYVYVFCRLSSCVWVVIQMLSDM